jgi:hypothetical protein
LIAEIIPKGPAERSKGLFGSEGQDSTMDKITFKLVERARANEVHGTIDGTPIETVYASGRVEGRSEGICDGRNVDRTYTREHGPVDLATVREARIRMGWSVVG